MTSYRRSSTTERTRAPLPSSGWLAVWLQRRHQHAIAGIVGRRYAGFASGTDGLLVCRTTRGPISRCCLAIQSGRAGESVPLSDLDEPYLYDLYAVVAHTGTLHEGHYTAYIRQCVAPSPRRPVASALARSPACVRAEATCGTTRTTSR